jgi:hypothetical protein
MLLLHLVPRRRRSFVRELTRGSGYFRTTFLSKNNEKKVFSLANAPAEKKTLPECDSLSPLTFTINIYLMIFSNGIYGAIKKRFNHTSSGRTDGEMLSLAPGFTPFCLHYVWK